MTGIDFEKAITALACWRSLRQENYAGMRSGAMALKNRADAEGKSIFEIAVQIMDENTEYYPDAREPQFQALLSVLDGIFAGTVADRVDGATHWYITGFGGWVLTKDVERTCQVGQAVFYKVIE